MATKGKASKAMQDILLQSALMKEKQIQETNNVATNHQSIQEQEVENNIPKEEPTKESTSKETVTPEMNAPEETSPSVSEKVNKSIREKKFSDYLDERKIRESEVIRISREAHKKLKQISVATGISLHVLASNIIEDICSTHSKEIQTILRKYMNM